MTEELEKDTNRHHEKMVKKKAARDKIMAGKTIERGLLIVHTGKGKGKSTAAFGMIFRHVGHGLKSGVVQFVKGAWGTGERTVLEKFPELVTIKAMGEGFTWETQDDARDAAAAHAAWAIAERALANPEVDLVLLDEFTYALKYRWLETAPVLATIARRPTMQHLIITGRAAPQELIDAADTVTEMKLVKHAFQSGLQAMPGIEW